MAFKEIASPVYTPHVKHGKLEKKNHSWEFLLKVHFSRAKLMYHVMGGLREWGGKASGKVYVHSSGDSISFNMHQGGGKERSL